MTLAGIVIAFMGASEVSVAVAPGVVCVEQSRLVWRLTSAGLHVVDGTSQRLAVTIRLEQQQVMVRATREGASFERAVPAQPDACEAIERVVTALITSWSRQLPSAETGERKPSPPATIRPIPPVSVEPVAEPQPETDGAHPDDQPPPLPEPPPALTPGPSAPPQPDPRPEVSRPLPTPPEPSAWPFTVDLAVLGGGSLGPTPTVSGVGQLHAGAALGRFGALLEGGLEIARSASLASARVQTSTQWLSLSGRVRFAPIDRLRLDLALGFRLWRIAAQSFDTLYPQSLELLGLGGVVSVGTSFQLIGPLSGHLRAFTSVRSRRDRFLIDGLGPVIELQPWEGGLLLGLEVRAFGGG